MNIINIGLISHTHTTSSLPQPNDAAQVLFQCNPDTASRARKVHII